MNPSAENEPGLAGKKCGPCSGGVEPLKGREIEKLLPQLNQGWKVVEGRRLEKQYKFKNFAQALDFVNRPTGRTARPPPGYLLSLGQSETDALDAQN